MFHYNKIKVYGRCVSQECTKVPGHDVVDFSQFYWTKSGTAVNSSSSDFENTVQGLGLKTHPLHSKY